MTEEVDYESLPPNAGLAVRSPALSTFADPHKCGRSFRLGKYAGRCTRQYQFFRTNKPVRSLALSQAGISEHAVMFPVDSIKVSSSGNALEEQYLKTLNRPECKFLQHLPWLSTVE